MTRRFVAALLLVSGAHAAEGGAGHPLLSIAREGELTPPPVREDDRARRIPVSLGGAREDGSSRSTLPRAGPPEAERPPMTRRVEVDERAVRAEVLRRLQARIRRRSLEEDGRSLSRPPEERRVPRVAPDPPRAEDPAPSGEPDLQSRLRGALDRARGLPSPTRRHAAAQQGHRERLPDDSASFRDLPPGVVAPPPSSRHAAPTSSEEPRGFVSPEEVRGGRGWHLPEELRDQESGLLPPEVTGVSTPPRRPPREPDRVASPSRSRGPDGRPLPETHVLQPGETLWSLARAYGTSVKELMHLNGIDSPDNLSVGRRVRIAGSPPPRPRRTRGAPAARRYTVLEGDTLFGIARAHGVTVDELLRANPEVRGAILTPGMELVVAPEGAGPLEEVAASPAAVRRPAPARTRTSTRPAAPTAPTPRAAGPAERRSTPSRADGRVPHLTWPVTGTVTSPFGWKEGKPHTGIDISAPSGTPIRAAAPGRVIYAEEMKDYGKVVILDHLDGFFTVYGNNSRNLVRKRSGGELTRVRQGDVIATVGATGDAVGPQLHFEVRKLNQAVDPMRYLAPSRQARAGRR